MRSADWVRKCLLLGVDRTYHGHHETDAIDPLQTSTVRHTQFAIQAGAARPSSQCLGGARIFEASGDAQEDLRAGTILGLGV